MNGGPSQNNLINGIPIASPSPAKLMGGSSNEFGNQASSTKQISGFGPMNLNCYNVNVRNDNFLRPENEVYMSVPSFKQMQIKKS